MAPNAFTPPVITMFSDSGGRYVTPIPESAADSGMDVGLEQQQLQRLSVQQSESDSNSRIPAASA